MASIDSRTRLVRKLSTAESLDADVCVVGSGAAGIMAALTSARLGRRTLLLEAAPQLGGQLVGTLLGTICGLYTSGPAPQRVTFGPVDEMLRALDEQGGLVARRALDTVVLQYDEALSGRWAERALVEAGVQVVVGAVLRETRMRDRRVESLEVATRWGDLKVRASGFVDASGDASVAWHAGLSVREAETPQWGTQMIVIEGFEADAAGAFDGFAVADALKRRKDEFGLIREDGFVFAYPGRGIATANLTHMPNPTDAVGATRAMLDGRDQADRVMALLRAEFPETLGKATIRAYGQPGIRQTRWFTAAHQLTLDEVRTGLRPPDAVARCAWPVEAHDSAEGVTWEVFAPNHLHYVPLASMVHRDADNLVAAGRCIDGDVAALASVRVMGPCFAMGQAAAHALDLCGRGSLHEVIAQRSSELADRVRDNLDRLAPDPWNEALA